MDRGPGAGDKGGSVIATGTPEKVAEEERSHTGYYLRSVLDRENGAKPNGKVKPKGKTKSETRAKVKVEAGT